MFFLALTTVFSLVLTARTSALNESVCARLPIPTANLNNDEYARFSGMHAVIPISERYPTSHFSSGKPWEMMGLADVELGPRGLFTRQQCIIPSYVPICPGPKPCCPPSYTVCCNSQGGCCPAGTKCGPAGTRACCPTGGKRCGDGCCDSGETCCGNGPSGCCIGTCCGSGCCLSGETCCGGNHCCDKDATCCGTSCCLSGWTCCGGTNCCSPGQSCDSGTGRCLYPTSTTSTAIAPTPSHDGDDGDEGPEIEVTIFPTDPQVEYNPPNAWNTTGGACTNGTKTTTQLGAEITFKFKGIELSVQFVPSQSNVTVTVELNGVELEEFVIPSRDSPVCQLVNAWNKTLPSSSSDHQVKFKYKSSGAPGLGRRAPTVLELGAISYVKLNSSSGSGSSGSKSHASQRTAVPGATALFMMAVMAPLLRWSLY